MKTKIIEATNVDHGGINHGKFLVGRFTNEWRRASAIDQLPLLRGRGWSREHVFVLDLQTGEGAIFRHGGYAKGDLDKRRILVCPMFEGFLTWLYQQDLRDLDKLPALVKLDTESAMYGYRRGGSAPGSAPDEIQDVDDSRWQTVCCEHFGKGATMDALGGPICHCGQPSAFESGVCAACGEHDLRRYRARQQPVDKSVDKL